MVSSRNFVLRLQLALDSPSKIECIHLTNLLYNASSFTSQSSLSISSPKVPLYYANTQLRMIEASHTLSTMDWSYDLCKELLEHQKNELK